MNSAIVRVEWPIVKTIKRHPLKVQNVDRRRAEVQIENPDS